MLWLMGNHWGHWTVVFGTMAFEPRAMDLGHKAEIGLSGLDLTILVLTLRFGPEG